MATSFATEIRDVGGCEGLWAIPDCDVESLGQAYAP
jgi:hypothetical protein